MNLARFGFLALTIAAPAVSRASIIYTNFATSFGYDTGDANEVGNDGVGDNLAEADTFTPGGGFDLSSIEIALSCFGSDLCPNTFTVDITTDSSGLPNTASGVLASFTVKGSLIPIFGGSTPITLDYSGAPVELDSDTPYWVVVLPDVAGDDEIEWNLNSTGDSSNEAVATDGGGASDTTWFAPFGTPGAYEIDGTPLGGVPEPGTLGLMLGGGALLGLFRKLRS